MTLPRATLVMWVSAINSRSSCSTNGGRACSPWLKDAISATAARTTTMKRVFMLTTQRAALIGCPVPKSPFCRQDEPERPRHTYRLSGVVVTAHDSDPAAHLPPNDGVVLPDHEAIRDGPSVVQVLKPDFLPGQFSGEIHPPAVLAEANH